MQAGKGQPDENRRVRFGLIHDGERVCDVVVERIGGEISGPIGLAISAAVISDAAKPLAEVGQLSFVDARVNNGPRWKKDYSFRAVAVNLVVDLHSVAFDEAFLLGQFRAH